jgi:hypothetical protein
VTQTYTSVNAAADPAAAQAMIEKAMASTSEPASVAAAPPRLRKSNGNLVTLPGGVLNLAGEYDHEAEVRELTGVDEEALARASTLPKMIDTLLLKGVVRVGEQTGSKALFDKMLAGDLDALLLGIRIATFGPDFEYESVTCPHCDHSEPLTLDLRTDVPSTTLGEPEDSEFTLELKNGKEVLVCLPDGSVQRALASSENRTVADLNTMLLSKCVLEIDGLPVAGPDAVRALSIRDRRDIIEQIGKRNPGPRLSEVSKSCTECSKDIPLPLSLTDLFRF